MKSMVGTVLEEKSTSSEPRRRLDITLSQPCRESVDRIIHAELEDDALHDRPARTKSAIIEMVLRKGVKTWEAERKANGPPIDR